ncbi:MAG: hypothetical protein AAF298_10485 [Cyanobacteria bacterium P01_A01_bin.40]
MNNKLNTEFNLDSLAQNAVGESTSTVERLYHGVCCLISFAQSLKERLEVASIEITPLLVNDFKEQNKDKFFNSKNNYLICKNWKMSN